MIDAELQQGIARALSEAQEGGELPSFEAPKDIQVERPKEERMGDYATPICLQLARSARMAPFKIAEILAGHLRRQIPAQLPYIDQVEVAAPGFINFRLAEPWLLTQVEAILAAGEAFGRLSLGEGRRVQVEYVSANPTGPLHIGSARNAVLGDALARTLDAAGFAVQKEYYVNDAGSRMSVFGETLYARYAQALGVQETVPEDGYHGYYMVEMGNQIAAEYGRKYLELPRARGIEQVGSLGLQRIVAGIRDDLDYMGIRYDCWFSEHTLYHDGQFERIMAILSEGGHVDEHDGAIWFKATELGGGKDEVLVRSDGSPGYFASDVAYHYNKFVERGFERVIDVWGADHQGHVPRMRAMMKALGLDPERLTIILYQLATLKRGGEIVRLSKRTGDIITLREVLEEVGSDAVRYFLVSRSADSQMDFDIELAKQQSDENPVYYIQYAHARICSILRYAGDHDYGAGDVGLLTSAPELTLIRRMLRLPEVVRTVAATLSPHHLAYYAYDLAASFHTFYRDCRVVSADPADESMTRARLKLVSACRVVLAQVLRLMGMSAPEVM
jgi:arginyl-tRNA synthetase